MSQTQPQFKTQPAPAPSGTLVTYLGPAVAVATVLAAVVVFLIVPPELLSRYVTHEGSLVETTSAILYFVLAACLLFWPWPKGVPRDSRLLVSSALLSILFGLRELDVNKRLTAESVTKINYYLDPAVPLTERLIAAVVILVIVVGVLAYVIGYGPRLWRAVRSGSAAGISVLTVVVLMPATKVADRLPNRLKEAGILEVPGSAKRLSGTLEEMLELALPIIMLIAFLQYWRAARKT
jgi:hypothetical protein